MDEMKKVVQGEMGIRMWDEIKNKNATFYLNIPQETKIQLHSK